MINNANASARERSPGSVKLLTKGRLVGAALVALFLIVATACGADQEDYFADLFGGDKEEFAFGWYDTPTADGAVSPIDAGIPVAKSQGLAVQLRPGEVALARMYDNYDKNKTVAVSAPDDFYVMPPKTADPSFEIFNYETNQRETLATEYYRETYYYIMALTPGAEATVTGSIGQYQTKDLKITCTGDDIFAPQTYKFDKRPHSFEIEGYGDVSFSLTYKRDGIQVAAGDVILPGTYDVEIGINNAYFKDLKLTKTSQLIIEMPERSEDGASRDNTLMHFYVKFPDTSVVHMLDPAARQNIQVYKFNTAYVYAVPSDPNAKVSGTQGTVFLRYGKNSFNTIVTAENGAEMHYPFRINVAGDPTQPAPSSDATLKGLTVTASNETCTLSPSFAPSVTTYVIDPPEIGPDGYLITATPTHSGARVEIKDKDGVAQPTFGIAPDYFPATITVTAQDNTTKKVYTLYSSEVAVLTGLSLQPQTTEQVLIENFEPDFDSGVLEYTADYKVGGTSPYPPVKIIASPALPPSLISYEADGVVLDSNNPQFVPDERGGGNIISVKVGGTEYKITLTVTGVSLPRSRQQKTQRKHDKAGGPHEVRPLSFNMGKNSAIG